MSFRRLRQFLSRSLRASAVERPAVSCEALESRALLTLTIGGVVADNRGEVQVMLNGQADPATVTRSGVQMYVAGRDGRFDTADDEKVRAAVTYTVNAKRISIRANLTPNTPYRVRIVATRVHDLKGNQLDGEFKGVFPTGNSRPGGVFVFQTRDDVSNNPTVRLNTSAGVINLRMLRKQKPVTVANFLSYANTGRYDNIIWTRSVPGFIIQAGSLQIDPSNAIIQTVTDAPIVNEFTTNGVVSNRRGTVAFAKQPNDPYSATNEFFLNITDNGGPDPFSLDVQNGGFTVFAQLADVQSYSVMDIIENYQTVALHNPLTGDGVLPDLSPTSLTDVPVVDVSALPDGEVQTVEVLPDPYPPRTQYVVKGGLDPNENLVVVKRTALLMKVAPLK